jgi:hypothetical protein
MHARWHHVLLPLLRQVLLVVIATMLILFGLPGVLVSAAP